jgi:hypothetical protein
MNSAILRTAAALTVAAAWTGCALREGRMTPTETVLWATAPVISERAIGTGFLVALRLPEAPGGFVPVVVTSGHLLKTTSRRGLVIPVRVVDGTGALTIVPAGGRVPVGRAWFVRHPEFDVAAFPLVLPDAVPTPVSLPLLEEANFAPVNPPRAGDEASFAGFPEGLPASELLFPVLRAGRVASCDQSVADLPYFLINADVFPGDSGSPVFAVRPAGRPRVTGMVIQRLEAGRDHALPLALAVRSGVIRETLDLLRARLRQMAAEAENVTRQTCRD